MIKEGSHCMFTRENTKAIKGIAIVLMLFHHIAGFPERFPAGFENYSSMWQKFVDDGYLTQFALTAKICVSIFFFLGGYGLYKRYEADKLNLPDMIISLYKQYWKVFVIFVPVAYLFFARTGDDINILTTRFVIESKKDFISEVIANFVGYSSSINGEWWFFASYLCAIPLGYLFLMKFKDKKNFVKDMFIVFIINILICNVFPSIVNIEAFANLSSNFFYNRFFTGSGWSSLFFEGIVFAKYDALASLKNKINSMSFNKILCILGIAVVFWARSFVAGGVSLDMVYVPFFVAFASVLLDCISIVNKTFICLGENSTNMWFVHSFYCYYFLECTGIVFSTKNVVFNLIMLILMSLTTSLIIDSFYHMMGKGWKKIVDSLVIQDTEESEEAQDTKEASETEETPAQETPEIQETDETPEEQEALEPV